ncbi:MAG TPA: hypothetical protein VGW34_03115 [Allosphingosinicella sp.]|nr:hypothetical protein [Allosphingosinicella sp.]
MNVSAAAVPPEILAWCWKYGDFALNLAQLFLYLALVMALIETGLLLAAKLRALLAKPAPPTSDSQTKSAPLDPVKLIEAVRALLETLKGLPAWVAIFLAGLALLWIAGEQPDACPARGDARLAGARSDGSGGNSATTAGRPAGPPGNSQAQAPKASR